MAKYRKKPVVITAVQLRWDTWNEMCAHADVGRLEDGQPQGTHKDLEGNPLPDDGPGLLIPTKEGLMLGWPGDYVIRGVRGELYACKPDIFAATYEPVDAARTQEDESDE